MLGYGQSPQLLQSGYSQGYWGSPQMLGAGFGGQPSMPFAPQGFGPQAFLPQAAFGYGGYAGALGPGGPQSQAFGPQPFLPMGTGAQAVTPIDAIAEDIADDLSGELANRVALAIQQYGGQVAPLSVWSSIKDIAKRVGKTVLRDGTKVILSTLSQQAQPQGFGPQAFLPQAAFGYGGYAGAPMTTLPWHSPYARPW